MALSLREKQRTPVRRVFTGTTPPKADTDEVAMRAIAEKLLGCLHEIEYDGGVYDIQDESSRISTPRPFPFKHTIDPRDYGLLLWRLSRADVITYKSVAQRNQDEFNQWLDSTANDHDLNNLVLVGSPSSQGDIVKLK